MAEMKNGDLALRMVQDDGVLLCGVKDCAAALSLRTHPAPADHGWALVKGWWLCPEHAEVDL